jgi:hypothetical protein
MYVEIQALCKARGGGVVTSVSRKGGHVSVLWDNGTTEVIGFGKDVIFVIIFKNVHSGNHRE